MQLVWQLEYSTHQLANLSKWGRVALSQTGVHNAQGSRTLPTTLQERQHHVTGQGNAWGTFIPGALPALPTFPGSRNTVWPAPSLCV